MILKVFDKEENYICNLTNLVTAFHDEELNGQDILEFSVLGDNVNAEHIQKKYRVLFKDRLGYWKEFVIEDIVTNHDNEGSLIEAYCESSFYETFGDYIDDRKPRNLPANSALEVALEPTRWEIGKVDDLGINSCNFYHTSAKEAVHKVAQLWEGEIRTRVTISGNRVTHRYVDLLQKRGNDLGKRYEYSKDLTSITRTVKSDYVVTALYGYGKGEHIDGTDGYGRRIDFADVEWSKANGDPVDKPLGQKWVGLDEVKEVWGRNNSDGTKSHVFGKEDFDDIEDPEELLRATWWLYKQINKPQVAYESKVIDLREVEGSTHEGVSLGDTVGVIDREFKPAIRVKARVLQYRTDLLNPVNDEVLLGNFIDDITSSTLENKKFIDNFRGKQGVWDRSEIIGEDGSINAQFLEDLIAEVNNEMNSRGGYVYLSDDGKGITTYNKPIDQNPTMAIQLLGGAFRIANRRKPNGEFDWRTFGDGDGFIADFITTGTLNASLLKTGTISTPTGSLYMDLDDDVFRFGGGTGDIVEHDNTKSKYIHEDGSYTEISNRGLRRRTATDSFDYNYLVYVGEVRIDITGNPLGDEVIVQLPDEFKGKNIKIFTSMKTFKLPWDHILRGVYTWGFIDSITKGTASITAALDSTKLNSEFGSIKSIDGGNITGYWLESTMEVLASQGTVGVQYIAIA